jgi:hypothetical protein
LEEEFGILKTGMLSCLATLRCVWGIEDARISKVGQCHLLNGFSWDWTHRVIETEACTPLTTNTSLFIAS